MYSNLYSSTQGYSGKYLSQTGKMFLNPIPGNDAMLHNLSFWMPNDTEVYSMLEGIFHIQDEQITSEGAISGAAIE